MSDTLMNIKESNGVDWPERAPTASGLASKTCPLSILVVMTAVMFVINITQLRLLHKLVGSLWLTLFPALIFVLFMAAFVFSCFWSSLIKRKNAPEEKPKGNVISFDNKDAGHQSLDRLSVLITIVLCIVLCEFVYINNFAVPDFETIMWTTDFSIKERLPVPAVVLFRGENVDATANLIDNNTSNIPCKPPPGDLQCAGFHNKSTLSFGDALEGRAEYVTYDPTKNEFALRPRQYVSLYYQYDYNGNDTSDPHLGFAAFDPQFINDFRQAYDCGLIIVQRFPAIAKVDFSVEFTSINDRARVAPSKPSVEACKDFHTRHPTYATYRSVASPLHRTEITNGTLTTSCDRRDGPVQPCWGNIMIWPWSMTNTSHTSSRKYRFKQALIDEGGIVGFVQFFVYFLTIWK